MSFSAVGRRVATHQRPPPGKERTTPRVHSNHGPARNRPRRRAAAPTRAVTPTPENVAAGPCSFGDLGIRPELLAVLSQRGIHTAFPIQAATLPDALAGRDVLGRGRTGSGKTLAFAIPTISALAHSGLRRTTGRPRALVLVPTRELANQVADTFAPLTAALGQRVTTVYGGVGQGRQVSALRGGIDILIACPGRLEDLLRQGHVHLDAVEVTVLDEADHMADLGFLPAVRRLLDLTPAGGQRLLFSATLDHAVDVLVRRYLTDPVVRSVDPPLAPVSTMEHHVFTVEHADKPAVIRELASGQRRSLLFTRTKHAAKKLAKQLTTAGVPAVELHGNLSQAARERNLAAFSAGTARVLVATDIAARGIHVDEIGLVVHVDPPAEHKAYLHRSGRTARAGAEGIVVTLSTPEQSGEVRTLTRLAGIKPMTVRVRPGDEQIAALTGPPAPWVTPPAPVTAPALSAPSRGRRDVDGFRPRGPRRPTRRRSTRRAA
ncbi:MAG TPA: DEAD/DEAH box helicase [Pseudonocardiaceae bacterium]